MGLRASYLLIVSAFFLLIVVFGFIGAFLFGLPKYYSIYMEGAETRGMIVSKDREQHQYIQAEYNVDGKKYVTGGRADSFGKDFDSVKIGDSVPIFYNKSRPSSAIFGDPDKHLNSSIISTLVVASTPLILFFAYVLRKILR